MVHDEVLVLVAHSANMPVLVLLGVSLFLSLVRPAVKARVDYADFWALIDRAGSTHMSDLLVRLRSPLHRKPWAQTWLRREFYTVNLFELDSL
jgi:hypothetical protein